MQHHCRVAASRSPPELFRRRCPARHGQHAHLRRPAADGGGRAAAGPEWVKWGEPRLRRRSVRPSRPLRRHPRRAAPAPGLLAAAPERPRRQSRAPLRAAAESALTSDKTGIGSCKTGLRSLALTAVRSRSIGVCCWRSTTRPSLWTEVVAMQLGAATLLLPAHSDIIHVAADRPANPPGYPTGVICTGDPAHPASGSSPGRLALAPQIALIDTNAGGASEPAGRRSPASILGFQPTGAVSCICHGCLPPPSQCRC